MKQLGIKSRVFIDILNQVPFGSSKTTNKDNISDVYANELFKANKDYYFSLISDVSNMPEWLQKFEAKCKAIDDAIDQVAEAKQWLVDNGYLFSNIYTKHDGRMKITYTGVTAKGWEVAPKYLALIQ